MYDASHAVDSLPPAYEGDETLKVRTTSIDSDPYVCWAFSGASGIGTHMDAPQHFKYGKAISDIAIERLVNVPLVIVKAGDEEPASFEKGSVVFFQSGHEELWPTPAYMKSFPGFPLSLAQKCVRSGCVGVGIDSPSTDSSESSEFEVHHLLLGQGLWQIENLRLNDLECSSSPLRVTALPWKLKDAPEAPCRVIISW